MTMTTETRKIRFSNGEIKEMTFEEVRESFKPMAFKAMKVANNKFIFNAVEEEDFMQELEIEIWRAYDQYDFESGNCFSTYLHYKLQKGVRNATYYKYAQKNQHGYVYSLNAPMGDNELRLEDLFSEDDTSIDNLVYSELTTLIRDNLDEKEEEIFKMLVDKKHYPVQVYADKYEITRQAANQRVIKLKKKLQNIVSNQYLAEE